MEREPFTQEDIIDIRTLRAGMEFLKAIQNTRSSEYIIFREGKIRLEGDETTRRVWTGVCAGIVLQLNSRGLGDIVEEEMRAIRKEGEK